ncbi:MAG TPA: hypothetical protein DDY74_02430 [Pseudothermotoga sp.]|nr:hypothetical protein [Pseudothermotoga sp.]
MCSIRILYYLLGFPPLHDGGLMVYAKDLALTMKELGLDVILLEPGYYNPFVSKTHVKFVDHFERQIPLYSIINPLPFTTQGVRDPENFFENSITQKTFEEFIDQIKPDVIHVHSLIGLPIEFLYAAKKHKIKLIYTTHDYYGICPKVRLFDINGDNCIDYENGFKCLLCNMNSPPTLQLKIKRNLAWLTYRYPRLLKIAKKLGKKVYRRLTKNTAHNESESIETKTQENRSYKSSYFEAMIRYYMQAFSLFDLFHFNSSISEKVYKKFVPTIKGKVINLTHRGIRDNRQTQYIPMKDGYLNITFLGNADDRAKGFHLVEKALRDLLENLNLKRIRLHVWGYSQRNFSSQENIIYHGKYSYNDLKSIFSTSDILIFTSICWETYGFVALEALSYGVPCLISERAGITDVVKLINKNMIITPSSKAISDAIYNLYKNPETLIKYHEDILRVSWIKEMKTHTLEIIEKFYK